MPTRHAAFGVGCGHADCREGGMHLHYPKAVPRALGAAPAPAPGPHLLDVSMFWSPASPVRQALMGRHERLQCRGWRHTIVAPGAHGPGQLDCGGLALPFTRGERWMLGGARARRQMAAIEPDIIESADPFTLGWAALAAAEDLRVPSVAFCHLDVARQIAPWGRTAEGWARRYLVEHYQHFDLVMAASRDLAQRLEAWGVPSVTVQLPGMDCGVFTPCARDDAWRAELCRQYGLAPSTRLILHAGPVATDGTLQMLADAVALLGRGHALVLAGSGAAAPAGAHVRLLPPEHDDARRARLMASCDVYVQVADAMAACASALEAMACGTPVVAASSNRAAEGANAAALPVDRPRAGSWAEAIDAALNGNTTAQRRAALARAQAQDWPRVLSQLTRRYDALIDRKAMPAALQARSPVPDADWPAGRFAPLAASAPLAPRP